MADVEDALVTLLNADGTVDALISDRLYPFAAPSGAALPYGVYEMTSAPRERTFGTTPPGNVHARYEFQWVAETPIKMRALATAAAAALNQHQAAAGTPIIDGVFLTNEWDEPGDVKDKRFIRVQEYTVHHRE